MPDVIGWKPSHVYKVGDEVLVTMTPRPRWWMRLWYWTTRQPWPKETNLYRMGEPTGTPDVRAWPMRRVEK